MLEKLYTRKAVIALMALILAANGFLLYQFQIKPPTGTANTPSSGESPRVPDAPREDEETEEPAEEKDEDERSEPDETEDAEDEDTGAAPRGSGDEEEPSGGDSPPPGAAPPETPFESPAPPETPFDSQYGSPPTTPGSGSAAGSDDLSRIRVALASFYDSEEGGADGSGGSGETSILPTTSGVGFLPAVVFVAAVVFGSMVIAVFRRR